MVSPRLLAATAPTALLFHRHADADVRVAQSWAEKEVALHGDVALAWRVANEEAGAVGGRVLTSDVRFLFAEVPVYETWSIPTGTRAPQQVFKWLRDHKVTHIIDHDGWPHGFESSDAGLNHGIRAFLQTSGAERIWQGDTHRVYAVSSSFLEPTHMPPR